LSLFWGKNSEKPTTNFVTKRQILRENRKNREKADFFEGSNAMIIFNSTPFFTLAKHNKNAHSIAHILQNIAQSIAQF
jgi:hypothetical protein